MASKFSRFYLVGFINFKPPFLSLSKCFHSGHQSVMRLSPWQRAESIPKVFQLRFVYTSITYLIRPWNSHWNRRLNVNISCLSYLSLRNMATYVERDRLINACMFGHWLYRKAITPAREPFNKIGLAGHSHIGTCDLGAISVKEKSCEKLESHISDRCLYYVQDVSYSCAGPKSCPV